jgi:hypothetical protein
LPDRPFAPKVCEQQSIRPALVKETRMSQFRNQNPKPPRLLRRAAAALAWLALVGSGQAQTIVTLIPSPTIAGQYQASFESDHALAGGFADTFSFVAPVNGTFSFVLDSLQPVDTSGVFFQGYEFNGGPIVFFGGSNVQVGPLPVIAGPQLLAIGGVVAPALTPRTQVTAGYTGTFTVQAIPEPATWLLMVGGLLALASRRFRTGRRAPS